MFKMQIVLWGAKSQDDDLKDGWFLGKPIRNPSCSPLIFLLSWFVWNWKCSCIRWNFQYVWIEIQNKSWIWTQILCKWLGCFTEVTSWKFAWYSHEWKKAKIFLTSMYTAQNQFNSFHIGFFQAFVIDVFQISWFFLIKEWFSLLETSSVCLYVVYWLSLC